MTRQLTKRLGASALAVLAAGSCSAGGDQVRAQQRGGGGSAPLVLATTSIWADVVANVACDGLATVEAIMSPGTDAHSFEPSLAARGRMQHADLVVANGLGLEESLAPTLDALAGEGVPVLAIGEHLTEADAPRAPTSGVAEQGSDDHGHDDDHDHGTDDHGHGHGHGAAGGVDPHVWFDPARVAGGLDVLAGALVEHAELEADAVHACVDAYRAELLELDAEIRRAVDAVPADRRMLVTNHDAFGAFADRYDFEVIGTVLPAATTLAEASPSSLAGLAALVEERQIRAIFTEEAVSDRDARALSERIGHPVAIVALYTESLGPAGSEAETYVEMLRTNASRIVDALSSA